MARPHTSPLWGGRRAARPRVGWGVTPRSEAPRQRRARPAHSRARRYSLFIPSPRTSLMLPMALSAKGRFARRREGTRPRRLRAERATFGTRAMPGLRPGPLRVPARSWLTFGRALSAFGLFERVGSRYRPFGCLTASPKRKARPGIAQRRVEACAYASLCDAHVARRKAPARPATDVPPYLDRAFRRALTLAARARAAGRDASSGPSPSRRG